MLARGRARAAFQVVFLIFLQHQAVSTQTIVSASENEQCKGKLDLGQAGGVWCGNTFKQQPALGCYCCAGEFYEVIGGSNGQVRCQPCAGTFVMTQLEHHETRCVSCTDNKVPSSSSGATSCTDCTPGKFFDSGLCASCPSGKYSNAETLLQCRNCTAGTYSTTTQAAQGCTDCPDGRYSYDGQAGCCRSGFRYVANPTPKCESIICSAGSYFGIVAFQPELEMSEIVYIPDCVKCAAGFYSDKTALSTTFNVCQQCTPGKYSSMDGATQCFNCPAGTYSEFSAVVCTNCPAGKYSGLSARTSVNDCSNCTAGTYSAAGASVCVCKAGYIFQVTSCVKCLMGKYAAEGDTVCRVCDAGKYSDIGLDVTKLVITVSNLLCLQNFAGNYIFSQFDPSGFPVYKSNHVTSKGNVFIYRTFTEFHGKAYWIIENQLGYAIAQDDSYTPSKTLDLISQDGTRKNLPEWFEYCRYLGVLEEHKSFLRVTNDESLTDAGATSCTDCAAGKFSALVEQKTSNACGMCVAGKYSLAASAVCTDCPAGQYSEEQGLTVCTECVAGKYSTSGQTRCEDCPSNSTSPAGSAANECVCDAGYEPVLPTGSATVSMPLKCSGCAPGKFKSRSSIAPAVAHVNYIDFEKCSTCVEGLYAAHREDPDDPYEA